MEIKKSQIHSDWKLRSCPSCGGDSFWNQAEISARKPAEILSFSEVGEYFIGLRSDQVFFSYHRCLDCGLLYCPTYFSQKQLDVLYSQMPNNLMGEDKSIATKTQSGYFNWFNRRIKSGSIYLEIGPDIGLLTQEFLCNFLITSTTLVEPNQAVHGPLREILKDVPSASILLDTENIVRGEPFDTIVAIHVIDHLLDPLQELKSLRSVSHDDSSFLVVVHNEASLLRKILSSKWPPFCLQHPQLYSQDTLGSTLSRSGWEIVDCGKSTNWQSLRHFIRNGARVLGLNVNLFNWLPSLQIPLRLGNQIALVKPLKH